jgi:SAM-dependent methyltransferase
MSRLEPQGGTIVLHTLRRLLWLGLAGWAVVSFAAIGFVIAMVRERYGRGGPIPVSQAQMLLNPLRGLIQRPESALRAFEIGEGHTVLELGPGPGYFSIAASRAVGPSGRVVCLDLQPGMTALLRERLRANAATNAHPVVGDATRLPLADGSVDRAFLVTVLGEVPDRPAAIAELRRVLKPGGVLGFSELLGDPDYVLMGWLEDLCRAYGFRRLAEGRMPLGYTLTFTAPGQRA